MRYDPGVVRCLVALVALVGCSDDIPPDERIDAGGDAAVDAGPGAHRDAGPPPTDAGPARPADPPGAMDVDFVIGWAAIGFEDPDDPTVAPGFDIDEHVTLRADDPIGCRQIDYTAPARFGGAAGVDNQASRLLPPLLAMFEGLENIPQEFVEAVQSGRAAFMMRLAGVGSLVNDGRVDVLFYTGSLEGGGAPRLEPRVVGGETVDVIAPGQRFVLDPASLIDGDPRQPAIALRDSFIVDGLLHTGRGDFSWRIPRTTTGDTIVLEFGDTRGRGEVSEAGITNGLLGGRATIEQIIALARSAGIPDDERFSDDVLRTILQSYADIDVDPAERGCEALSIAAEFEASPCVIVGP